MMPVQHGLVFVDVDCGHARRPARKAPTSPPGSISGARLVFTRAQVNLGSMLAGILKIGDTRIDFIL